MGAAFKSKHMFAEAMEAKRVLPMANRLTRWALGRMTTPRITSYISANLHDTTLSQGVGYYGRRRGWW